MTAAAPSGATARLRAADRATIRTSPFAGSGGSAQADDALNVRAVPRESALGGSQDHGAHLGRAIAHHVVAHAAHVYDPDPRELGAAPGFIHLGQCRPLAGRLLAAGHDGHDW